MNIRLYEVIVLIFLTSLAGGVIASYFDDFSLRFGATTARTTITNPWTFSTTTTHSSTGTAFVRINFGKCIIHSTSQTIAASTTQAVSCQSATNGTLSALTGISAGDVVFVSATSTWGTTTKGGLLITQSYASTTAGYIHMVLLNNSDQTFTFTANASTSVNYFAIDSAILP